jgi:hypothetical protein
MKATAKRHPPAPASEPRRRRADKPELARCEVRTLRPEPTGAAAPRPVPKDWEPPVLEGKGKWIGGSLRREEIYGDDGR